MQELFECGPMAGNDRVSEAALLVEADNVGVGEVRSILPPRLRYRPSPCEERGLGGTWTTRVAGLLIRGDGDRGGKHRERRVTQGAGDLLHLPRKAL